MYTNLFIKTNYSLLQSLITLDDLFNYAQKNNLKALAICDDNLKLSYTFYKRCLKEKIKPLIGLHKIINGEDILIYAKNEEGFKDLIKYDLKNDLELIDINSKNVYTLVPHYLNKDNLYISYTDDSKSSINKAVFVNKTIFLEEDDERYIKYLDLIRDGESTYKKNPTSPDLNLPIFKNINFLVDNINITFKKEKDLLPIYDKDAKDILIKKVEKALKEKNLLKEEYINRSKLELKVIIDMNYADYFLIVEDFIKYAESKGILVGPGRGSAGGSLICFLLGITKVDPLKYHLYFERFLNKERITMPDIDTDFPDIYRDEVIDYVSSKYGYQKVCGIMTLSLMQPRQLLRDASKILNISKRHLDIILKEVPVTYKGSFKKLIEKNNNLLKLLNSSDELRLLKDIALKLDLFPRHTSVHAAGVIISNKNLDEIIPLTDNGNLLLSQYSYEELEEIGLLKMDFLGIRNLTTIMNILDDIKLNLGKDISFHDIALNDEKVYDLFKRGDTLGIFQFEKDGMRDFLRKLKPDNFEEIALASALYRPGPSENIPRYLARKFNKERVTYIDDSLKDILASTKGIIVYQEQIMQILNKYASFSLAKADIFRRAMSKKKAADILNMKEDFINSSIKNGHDKAKTSLLFDSIASFAGYGFNKAHAIAYSLIAVRMAYLKVYYPLNFYKELMNSAINNPVKLKEYIDEALKNNIVIKRPELYKSKSSFTFIDKTLYMPFNTIKKVTSREAEILSQMKEEKEIFDVIIYLLKNNFSKETIDLLNKAGLFKNYLTVKEYDLNEDNILNYASIAKDVEPYLINKPSLTKEGEYSSSELYKIDMDLFNFYLGEHPTSMLKKRFSSSNIKEADKLNRQFVTFIGLVKKVKKIKTKNGDDMAFVDLEDDTGEISAIYFKDKIDMLPEIGEVLALYGRLEKRGTNINIITKRSKKLL